MKRIFCVVMTLMLLSASVGGAAGEALLASGVTDADMLRAEYWIAKSETSGDVLLTREEIARYNETLLGMKNPDGEAYLADWRTAPETLSGAQVAEVILSCKAPEGEAYRDGEPVPADSFAELDAYRNIDALPEQVSVRFAVSVRRLNARAFPTDDLVVSEADDRFYDELQMAEIMPFAPLMVLHETEDGKWLWVRSYAFYGWVHAEDVAFFDSREAWLEAFAYEDFLVVTASRMRLEEDPYCPALSGLELYMGNVLPLSPEPPESVNRRAAYGSYVVRLPLRGADGMAVFTDALVPISSDVHIGYLEYSAENVLTQAFKLLGERYGWGGLYGANDCSGILGQIFACFGFRFPRSSAVIASMPAYGLSLGELSAEEKQSVIESLAPGSLLFFPGHIMLYLGSENGDCFVLSATGSMVDPQDGALISVSGVIVNDLDVLRKNGKTWLESLTAAVTIRPADAKEQDISGGRRAVRPSTRCISG